MPSPPVIVPLHGLFGSPRDWNDLASALTPACTVVVPQLPLYTLPPAEATVDGLLSFVDRFVGERGLTAIHLVGNSLGGLIALLYAERHPGNVATIALTGSSGLRENSLTGYFITSGSPPRRDDYALVKRMTEMIVHDPAVVADRVDEVYGLLNDPAVVRSIVALAKSASRVDMRERLKKIAAPACLIWGRDDAITPVDVAEDFRARLPHADLLWIDACGHAPMIERPEAFNTLLREWYAARGYLASG